MDVIDPVFVTRLVIWMLVLWPVVLGVPSPLAARHLRPAHDRLPGDGEHPDPGRGSPPVAVVAAAAALLATSVGLSACSGPGTTGHLSRTADYLPGRAADVYLPDDVSAAPVVVLVPGGAWRTADRRGLAPLAEALAVAGVVAVSTTHLAVDDGGRFPGPVQDVTCSVGFAVAAARQSGIDPTHVVVLGHSSGGHLAGLAALAPDRFRASCPYPPARPDGFIGLAGTYDVDRYPHLALSLFGADARQRPDLWHDGNVLTWAHETSMRARVSVLLLHGAQDADVRLSGTDDLAEALHASGFRVLTEVIPDATHATIYTADVAGPRVLDWLEHLDDEAGVASTTSGTRS